MITTEKGRFLKGGGQKGEQFEKQTFLDLGKWWDFQVPEIDFSTPWKMNGWNLQPSPIFRKENYLNQTSMIMCKMLIFRGVKMIDNPTIDLGRKGCKYQQLPRFFQWSDIYVYLGSIRHTQ